MTDICLTCMAFEPLQIASSVDLGELLRSVAFFCLLWLGVLLVGLRYLPCNRPASGLWCRIAHRRHGRLHCWRCHQAHFLG